MVVKKDNSHKMANARCGMHNVLMTFATPGHCSYRVYTIKTASYCNNKKRRKVVSAACVLYRKLGENATF